MAAGELEIPLLELMPPDVRAVVEASLAPVEFGFGDVIVREGDEADAMYVITAGQARAAKAGDGGQEVPLSVLQAGDAFGEVALFTGGRRTATVRASGPVNALRLDRAVFAGLARANPGVAAWAEQQWRRFDLHAFLQLRSAFAALSPAAIAALLERFDALEVCAGERVIEQGSPQGPMYVVREGRLRVTRAESADDEPVVVGFLRAGDLFGERSLLTGEERATTVQSLTACRLLALAPEALRAAMEAQPDLRRAIEERVERYDFRRVAHVPLDFADELLPAEADVEVASVEQDELDELQLAEDAAEEAAAAELFHRPARAIRRFPEVWQVDENDCGAACLAMACSYFGNDVPLPYIRDVAGTGLQGTSLRGLVAGAEALGLAARSLKTSKSRLDELPLPAICHWGGSHWIVLYATGARSVRVSDPARGRRRLARSEFEQQWSGYCCLVAATPALTETPGQRSVWRWLLPFLRPHVRTLAGAALLAIFAAGLQMLVPVGAGEIVDRAIARDDRSLVLLLALGMVGVLFVALGAALLQRRLLAWMAMRLEAETLGHITARLLSLPLAYLATRRSGDLERRLGATHQARLVLTQEGVAGLSAVAQLAVATVVMVVYSVPLAAVYLGSVPAYALTMRGSRRRLRSLLPSVEEAYARYRARQLDATRGFESIKAGAAEEQLSRRLRDEFEELSGRVAKTELVRLSYDAAVQLLTFLTLAAVVSVGGLLVLDGSLSIGELVAFTGLVVLANGSVAIVLRLWDQLQEVSVLLGGIDDLLAEEPEQGAERSHLRAVPTLGGDVRIEGFTVRTSDVRPVTILESIDLDVAAGTTVAIVGRSGAGKTTLVKSLAGLVTPTSGRVLYDGVDLATLDYHQLRRRVGFALQDSYLFDDTIAANIALGEDNPDPDQLRWAAGVAEAADLVDRLPLGYDTRVGQSGIRLSAGQAQRIAIARAVYRRPPVLILDEATSALDLDSERAVMAHLDELLEGRTAFIVAHRLSAIRGADVIVVLERGRIAERGSHGELIDRRGLYWYLLSQELER